jgi:phosphate transport system substrate-binding protein
MKVRRLLKVFAVLFLGVTSISAQNLRDLPEYKPEQKLGDCETVRSWGSSAMSGLMKSWEEGFRKYQPGVRFSDNLKGTETAQAALYSNIADLGLMDREILLLERHVMLRRTHHLPLEITVANGSYDVPDKAFALAVFVNRDNPISKLSLKQLDGIFGDQRTGVWDDKFRWHPELAREANKNIRTWGQVGLMGEWANKPIHVYGYPITIYSPFPGPMLFFRAKALGGGDLWNPDLLEFEKGQQITEALGQDPYGIAYTCPCYKTPGVKPVALANAEGTSYVEPTRENVAGGKYPLTRSVYIYIDRGPENPVDPKVKEFLRYILSREGQQAVAREGGYLPLTAEVVREQLRKLE